MNTNAEHKSLLAAFANLPSPLKAASLREFWENNGLANLQYPLPVGRPPTFKTRFNKDWEICFSKDDYDALQSQAEEDFAYVYGASSPHSMRIHPGMEEFLKTLEWLESYKENIYRFLQECSAGALNYAFLDLCLQSAQESRLFGLKRQGWAPELNISLSRTPYPLLEDQIEINAILLPIIQGGTDYLKKCRQCGNCGNFFFPKLERAKFCSNVCRNRFNQKGDNKGK